MLPEAILKQAQEELLDWHNLGMSVMEVGHRTPEFAALLSHAEATLREILAIPSQYQVLFMGGAARTHFAMIPMNFLNAEQQAGYLVTGIWSQMAFLEAQRLKTAYCVASSEAINYKSIPDPSQWDIKANTEYLFYTPNETVNGVRFPYVPAADGIPLIADMTSCLLSEPIDITQYGLIFAGAQKNIANAGMTVVIVRDDLLAKISSPHLPTMLDYKIQADHHSIYATPPVFNCYLAGKMFDWIKQQGGVQALYQQNCQKAARLYDYLDSSDFYSTSVAKADRSLMNVCFSMNNVALENRFVQAAEEHGLAAIRGHRLVGGLRASLYNAMPMAGVEALIEFMKVFAQENSL